MNEDMTVDVQMYFKQIIALVDLIIETDNGKAENLLTLRNLADLGLASALKLE